jgi:DNA ligase D-like protein (predicted polymerase)
MGTTEGAAVEIEVAGRAVRVSSPDRVIFEATDRTPAATKLDVARYYAVVATRGGRPGEPRPAAVAGGAPSDVGGLLRALWHRPTTLERWPRGYREGMVLATRQGHEKDADAFYQKRVPSGAPAYVETATIAFPSGRTAAEIAPTEPAVPVWAAHMGTIVFHPWPVRSGDVEHPDELRIDLDPQPGTDFADARRVAAVARDLFEEIGVRAFPKTSGKAGIHVFVRIEPRWTFTDVRHAAIAFGRELGRRMPGVTTAWWKEERGEAIFVDYNQNARDRTIAAAYSLRPRPGAPVSTPVTWDELADLDDPRELDLWTVPERLSSGGGPNGDGVDPWAEIDDVAHSIEPLLAWYERDEAEGLGDLPYPPEHPKMAGEPSRVQPSRARKPAD